MLKKIFTYLSTKLQRFKQSYFVQNIFVKLAFLLNTLSNYLRKWSRDVLHYLNPGCHDLTTDFYNRNFIELTKEIQSIINSQKKHYEHHSYFYGYPYQGFSMIGVFGERPTEERYESYLIDKFLKPSDKVLDLGCSCGFLAIYSAFKIGCNIEGIDINPYSIQIGEACAKFLKVSDKVKLHSRKIQDFFPASQYNAIYSFATHWTDDRNYRVPLKEHLKRLLDLTTNGGYIFFESHCSDLNNKDFLDEVKQFSKKYVSIEYEALTDCQRRHFYIFKKT